MTNMNDEILVRGVHSEIRIVVFADAKQAEDGSATNIGIELNGCADCLMNAIAVGISTEERLLRLFAAALSKGVRMKMTGQSEGHLPLYRHDKNGVNPNLN